MDKLTTQLHDSPRFSGTNTETIKNATIIGDINDRQYVLITRSRGKNLVLQLVGSPQLTLTPSAARALINILEVFVQEAEVAGSLG